MIQPEPDALQEVLQDLHQRGEPWLPAGLGSRLDWGPAIREPCQVVSCARLDRTLEHSPGDFTITVEAGMPLVKLQELLEQRLTPVEHKAIAEEKKWREDAKMGDTAAVVEARRRENLTPATRADMIRRGNGEEN